MDPDINVKQETEEVWFTGTTNIKLENDNTVPQMLVKQEIPAATRMAGVGGAMTDGKRGLEDPAAGVSPTKKSNTGVGGYWCEICKMNLKNDEISISHHNSGTKHVKKAAAQAMLLKLSEEYDCFEQDPESGILRCVLCNIVATSPPLLEAHFNGSKHKSKVDGATNGTPNGGAKPAATVTTPAAVTTTPATAIANGTYWCEICKLRGTTTPTLIATHMNGSKHKKKQASFDLIQKLRTEDDCFIQDQVSGILKCIVCSLDMATAQQLEAHLSGNKHRAKAQGTVPNTGDAENEMTTDGYWCQICRLSGTHTPMSVAAHVNGAKHLRKVAGHELLEKLKESTDCFDHDEATGMLKCRVCNIEVNTPQLLDVHLNGTKHKNKVEGKPVKRKHDGDPNYTPAKRVAPNPEDAERTVFLKNMSFKSTEEDIRAVFEDCGEIESLYCIKDFRGRNKGFGYLMFKEKEAAVKALEKDKTVLEERPMYVSAYNPEERRDHKTGEPEKDKLFVSGIPVTMTEEEIRGLFEPHGEIKDIRLLRKKEEFKGMCYLDYNDEETAAAVKEATDQFEIGPEQKITVQFSYPPRPRRSWRGRRHYHRHHGGGGGAAVPQSASLGGGEEGGANNIAAPAEVE